MSNVCRFSTPAITDQGKAINVEIDGDHMAVRLESDVGVMHFESTLPQ